MQDLFLESQQVATEKIFSSLTGGLCCKAVNIIMKLVCWVRWRLVGDSGYVNILWGGHCRSVGRGGESEFRY